MLKPVALSGNVSHVERFSSVSGAVYGGTGSVNTYDKTLFRVDGKPASFQGTPVWVKVIE